MPALGSHRIAHLLESQDGTLWISSEQGFVSLYREGRFSACGLLTEQEISCDLATGVESFFALHEDPSGAVWLGRKGLLLRFDAGNELAGVPAPALRRIESRRSCGKLIEH